MTTERATVTHEERRSWIPMIGLFLAQILMSFNVAARNSQRPWYQARRPRPLRIAQQHNVIRCHDLMLHPPPRGRRWSISRRSQSNKWTCRHNAHKDR